ncbi:MAG TPA: hypothetical protein VHP13_02300 [Gammaproteobacteria bacterium]|jgi:uncharacterized membrane protein|nr:hypothetical protein [Gammaproteobacteria bacterium]
MHKHTARGLALATAAASLFALAPLAAGADASTDARGYCYGVNACKGKSSCKTAESGCQGQNACKGKGMVDDVSDQTCAQLGGRFSTEDPMKK